jgi:glutaredoxin
MNIACRHRFHREPLWIAANSLYIADNGFLLPTGTVLHTELRVQLVDLFLEAGRAHHAAFAATDGADPDWPIWYAEYLQAPVHEAMQVSFTKSQLVYCLMHADFEHTARAPESDWPEFYADHFVECFSLSDAPTQDKLALYYSRTCPFCTLVTKAIDRLGLDVEPREIFQEPRFRDELVAARGRATVPVLRINSPDGEERWMPESQDIVHYLEGVAENSR